MQSHQPRYTLLQAIALLVLLILSCAGLLLAIVGNPGFDIQRAIPQYAPILVVVEVFIYLLGLLLFFKSIDLLTAFCISLALAALRALASFAAAAIIHDLFPHLLISTDGGDLYKMWQFWASLYLGNPAFTMIQVLLIAGAILPFIGFSFPGLVGINNSANSDDTDEGLDGDAVAQKRAKSSINLPMGGFVQCYSYEDLRNTVRKVPNLIGYALATSEGLLVFGDGRRLALPLDSTVPRFQVGSAIIHQFQERSGMPRNELWQFGDDQVMVMMTINPCFFLLLFFRPDIDLREIQPRLKSVRLSAESFLMDRHRLLMTVAEESA